MKEIKIVRCRNNLKRRLVIFVRQGLDSQILNVLLVKRRVVRSVDLIKVIVVFIVKLDGT